MGLFSKPIVTCSVCGRTVGEKEKRWATKDGYLCPDCQKPFGVFDGPKAFVQFDTEQLKKMKSDRTKANEILKENRKTFADFKPTKVIENTLFIDEKNEKWYFSNQPMGAIGIDREKPVPFVFNFSDIIEVYTSVGGKKIVSTSSTRKEKGLRKAWLGYVLAGSTGALLGGMMARSKTLTNSTELQNVFVNVVFDEGTEPISIPYPNEQCAEKVHHMLASMIKEPDKSKDTPALSPADEIMKYKQLLDMGAINQEEFEAKKKQLLEL